MIWIEEVEAKIRKRKRKNIEEALLVLTQDLILETEKERVTIIDHGGV